MSRAYFESIESYGRSTPLELEHVIPELAFNEQGLIPVIAQDATTKQVLMMAWMNHEALEKTLETQRMTYWSRSRQAFWIKGETSGHTQKLIEMAFDCDGDTLLCQVEQHGGACHTGRTSCFYLEVDNNAKQVFVQDK